MNTDKLSHAFNPNIRPHLDKNEFMGKHFTGAVSLDYIII